MTCSVDCVSLLAIVLTQVHTEYVFLTGITDIGNSITVGTTVDNGTLIG